MTEATGQAALPSCLSFRTLPAVSPLWWGMIAMVPDPPQDTLRLPAAPGAEPVRDKVRIRFRKGGDLRLVSHHDLMHVFERMFRRATLPFHSTEGFNPKPRMAFALSLALG